MANKSNFTKRTLILIGVFAVTAVIGSIVLKNATNKEEPEVQATTTPTATVQVKPKAGAVTPSQEQKQAELYTDVVKEYDGRRVQFDINCQAIPSNLTYKTGTKIMLDNRSGDPRIITVDGTQHSLAGYGYKIITLTSQTLPKNLLISCGSAVNVGQILLQN